MIRTAAYLTVVFTALLLSSGGCTVVHRPPPQEVVVIESERRGGPPPWAPAHGWRRKHETYYYYPTVQVYYYPSVQRYYWLERGEWRIGARLPTHYIIEEDKKIVLDLDYEPHTRHGEIKRIYPPDYHGRRR